MTFDLTRFPVRRLFGVPIHALRMQDVLDAVDEAVERRRRLLIGVVNAAKLVNMQRDPVLRESVMSADLTVADGMGVVWACRWLGQPLPERVAGIDLMFRMLERADAKRYRVYCLGAVDEVLDRVVAGIQSDYPQAVIAGCRNGYFNADEEPAIAEKIKQSHADLLFVAISPPKKEQFLARWSDHMNVPVCHGVGGAFDVMAGKVRRAPDRWQRWGLEWLYRVRQEPRRMWRRYLVTNTLFCGMFLAEWFKRFRSDERRWITPPTGR